MKLNTSIKKAAKGVTLIELSVVIAVLLVLISVLFIGATYYRDSANNAACVVAQSSLTKGLNSYYNISNDTLLGSELSTTGPFIGGVPACPTAADGSTDLNISWDVESNVASVTCENLHGTTP